ncbi:MAG TPA: radical SAM protein [Desulfobacteraceae bacterium]|nr:radical SAM protein [Desulfobacteraceae bacterium]
MPTNDYNFETGVFRPPSEGGAASLLVRFTRNCPWNHCTFCAMYKHERFSRRSLEEITSDIDAMAALARDLRDESERLGHNGRITRDAVLALFKKVPGLNHHNGAAMLIQWLMAGGSTAFLQDGNSLIMPPKDLVAALSYLKSTFPSIRRITTYARARTIAQRAPDTLRDIRKAGLDRVHLGLETGDDELLKKIKKGVTAEGHIQGGQKAMDAGFQVSEYWMPGLGGKELTEQHARNTARVLNAVNPHYIRSRPFRPLPGTPIYDEAATGAFVQLTPKEQLLEIKAMVQALEVTSKVCFDHAANHWRTRGGGLVFSHDYEGYKFPEEKDTLLERIEDGLAFDQPPSTFLHL